MLADLFMDQYSLILNICKLYTNEKLFVVTLKNRSGSFSKILLNPLCLTCHFSVTIKLLAKYLYQIFPVRSLMFSLKSYSPAQFEYWIFTFIFGFHFIKSIVGKVDLCVSYSTHIS